MADPPTTVPPDITVAALDALQAAVNGVMIDARAQYVARGQLASAEAVDAARSAIISAMGNLNRAQSLIHVAPDWPGQEWEGHCGDPECEQCDGDIPDDRAALFAAHVRFQRHQESANAL